MATNALTPFITRSSASILLYKCRNIMPLSSMKKYFNQMCYLNAEECSGMQIHDHIASNNSASAISFTAHLPWATCIFNPEYASKTRRNTTSADILSPGVIRWLWIYTFDWCHIDEFHARRAERCDALLSQMHIEVNEIRLITIIAAYRGPLY